MQSDPKIAQVVAMRVSPAFLAAYMRRSALFRRQRGGSVSILAVNGFVPSQCYTNVTVGVSPE